MIAYIVKARGENTWSGPGPGDPDFPALGCEVVHSVRRAHRFTTRAKAEAEAATYLGGADVIPVRTRPRARKAGGAK